MKRIRTLEEAYRDGYDAGTAIRPGWSEGGLPHPGTNDWFRIQTQACDTIQLEDEWIRGYYEGIRKK